MLSLYSLLANGTHGARVVLDFFGSLGLIATLKNRVGLWDLTLMTANSVESNTSHPLLTLFTAFGSTLESLTVLCEGISEPSTTFVSENCRGLRHLKLTMTEDLDSLAPFQNLFTKFLDVFAIFIFFSGYRG